MRRKLIAVVMIIAMMVPLQAFAQGAIEPNKDVSLTVKCEEEGTILQGMDIDVYRMADVDETGNYSVADEFKAMEEFIDFSNLGGENGDVLAQTLSAYVGEAKVQPISGKTDASGCFTVTGKAGMYLVVGHRLTVEGKSYEFTPFLVAVPGRNDDNNTWEYNVTAYPKCMIVTPSTELSVAKVWKASDNHPNEVVVELLKDGKVVDTVKLNKDNNWEHSWTDLDPKAKYTVRETNLVGYKVSIVEKNHGFIITNTEPGYVPPTDTPGGKLPQTGQLWWPVLVLLLGGLSFIAIGLFRKKRASER